MWRRSALAFLVAALAAPAAAAPPSGDAPTELQQLVWKGVPVYCGGGHKRFVALTFDDGPSPWTTQLVSALHRNRVPATFFLVGSRIVFWPAGARAAAGAGVIGNHTWSHPHLLRLRPNLVERQLRWTQLRILQATRRLPALFRPPYEQANARVDRIARTLGLVDVRWSIDSGDSLSGASATAVVRHVLATARPGAIVLLHDSHAWDPAVVAALARGLRALRLKPVTLTTMLELDPPRGRAACR